VCKRKGPGHRTRVGERGSSHAGLCAAQLLRLHSERAKIQLEGTGSVSEGRQPVELVFEHKGAVNIRQRSNVHGDLTHMGRDVRIHCVRPYGQYSLVLLFGFMEVVFREPLHFTIAPDGIRYCEVFSCDGRLLFDSRRLIPCEPPTSRRIQGIEPTMDRFGKRSHPRLFRDLRNQ